MRILPKVYLLILALVLSAMPAAAQTKAAPKTAPKAAPKAARTVIITAGDDMKFSVTEIAAKPGEVIKLRLLAIGTMPAVTMRHNVVVLKAGSNQIDFVEAAAKTPETDYIPTAMKGMIVAETKLIENGQSAEVTFTVPAKPGNYPYMCTFPGHMAAGARGKMIVK
jgi:azurin